MHGKQMQQIADVSGMDPHQGIASNRGFTAMKSQNGKDTSHAQVNRPHGSSECSVEYDELLYSKVGC